MRLLIRLTSVTARFLTKDELAELRLNGQLPGEEVQEVTTA